MLRLRFGLLAALMFALAPAYLMQDEIDPSALDARSVSTVATHAGETLYGRSYKIEMLDKHGDRL